MKPIANILVPLDFSGASRSALTYACGLADVCGASLHLLHAFQMPLIPGGSIEVCVPDQQLFEQLQDDGRQLLNEALTDEEKRRYHAVLVQRSGPAVKEILGYVRERGDMCSRCGTPPAPCTRPRKRKAGAAVPVSPRRYSRDRQDAATTPEASRLLARRIRGD